MSVNGSRKVHAVYLLTWWDKDWNEIAASNHLHTAGEMCVCIERWNAGHQRACAHHTDCVVCDSMPVFLTVEVRYVER